MGPQPRAGLLFAAAALAATAAAAQLSPGELADPHAQLEGASHCLDCHSSGRGVDPDACLACHRTLSARIERGDGLHAAADMRECQGCHIEHNGREFELVYWGDEGREAFEHSRTGYVLEGAHEELECRACHRRDRLGAAIRDASDLDPERTFLGLSTECEACHEDPHGERFAGERCTDCHDSRQWRPAEGFDHERTGFPLRRSHRSLSCASCHADADSPDVAALDFPSRGTACADCHRDPHAGRLGAACRECHDEGSWSGGARRGFDHSRTRYPLRGRHAVVACEKCHSSGVTRPIAAFDRCSSCHADPHRGELAHRPDGGACESCHDVEAFEPPRFTVAEHADTDYPLAGAHRAVACDACHRAGAEAGRPREATPFQFRLESGACTDCHGSPHGDAGGFVAEAGCLSCHDLESWTEATFDHSNTHFPLGGGHADLTCGQCHGGEGEPGSPGRTIPLAAVSTACSACHDDPHREQFAGTDGNTACERCHVDAAWETLLFRHDRDSSFVLEGAHLRAACQDCHPAEVAAGSSFVRYRPLGRDCVDCHLGPAPVPKRH